jgi:hypothetical protein
MEPEPRRQPRLHHAQRIHGHGRRSSQEPAALALMPLPAGQDRAASAVMHRNNKIDFYLDLLPRCRN